MTVHEPSPLVFLKLGGSLITDKRLPEEPRRDVIAQLAAEIGALRQMQPGLRLLIGHGSGSFGHLHARKYGTRAGVQDAAGWYGFAAVADAAARLNRIVIAALLEAQIPAWSIQPGALLHLADGAAGRSAAERAAAGDALAATVSAALARGLAPVVYGDVALDSVRGGTIASTEEIFELLALRLQPQRLVLAGEVDGIYTADPQLEPAARPIAAITPQTLAEVEAGLGGSHGVDVTGGMRAKVEQTLRMVTLSPGMDVIICSGLRAGHIGRALAGELVGTRISAGTGDLK